jgi:radical SAM protein with 4Fe4S-binding SPASM domain
LATESRATRSDPAPLRLVSFEVADLDRWAFFNPASGACLVTNSKGARALKQYLKNPGEMDASGRSFVERLGGTPIMKRVDEAGDYGEVPQRLIVELTAACNLRCRTCYMSAGSPRPDELATEEVLSLMRDAAAAGVETVAFIGGEPFMRADLARLTEAALESFADVMISTNGTLATEGFLDRFRGRRNLAIQVSLDGPDPTSNDVIRGRGTFAKAARLLDLAGERGLRTAISSVLNRNNYSLVGRVCDLGAQKGCLMTIFHKVHVSGRAQDSPELLPGKRELAHGMGVLLEKFGQYEGSGRMIVDFPHNRCFRGDSTLDAASLGCHFGRASAYVTSQGDLACCSHLRDGEFLCGSVRTRPLAELWQESGRIEELRRMTVDDIPSCRSCDFKYMCRGSCRADALGHSGDIKGDPPDCEAMRSYYSYVLDYYARNLEALTP